MPTKKKKSNPGGRTPAKNGALDMGSPIGVSKEDRQPGGDSRRSKSLTKRESAAGIGKYTTRSNRLFWESETN